LKNAEKIISRQNKEITDSINYAKHIQKALLPNQQYVNNVLNDNFVLFKPRDVVSGDFYFVKKMGNIAIVAAADCTGHGVPGAMLSVLSYSIIDEIIRLHKVQTMGEVLNLSRKYLKKALKQTKAVSSVKDGLDVSLCAIDFNNRKLEYAGANNSVYIIRQGNISNDGIIEKTSFIELKADRQPIGIYPHEKPFTNHVFDLEKNDQIYMFSDGYPDQFGGPKSKKFMTKHFKNLLVEISNEPMDVQKDILISKHNQWKGNLEQVDDILVIGIKV